jgi:hypothetical protein
LTVAALGRLPLLRQADFGWTAGLSNRLIFKI